MPNTTRSLAPALIACAAATAAPAAELTIGRLFDAPDLAGPSMSGVRISPDGSRVTYLQGKADNKDRLDLWEYSIADRARRLLVDSAVLAPTEEKLSDEEQARRERKRTAQLSGILEYDFAPSGKGLLFPLGGDIYYYQLDAPSARALTRVTATPAFETDAKVSPRGRYVAFIREQNLVSFDLQRREETQLTRDGGGTIKNGMAEFIAQEEMDRSSGYWWSPDDTHIAFTRVDESQVRETQRFEIAADNVAAFAQRYPAAGEANVTVRVGVIELASKAVVWVDLGADSDVYIARVDWLPDGKTLAIQRQSRDQRRLELIFADIATGKTRVILTETSQSWIDLHDELTFLRKRPEFLWASSRDGYRHLYLYGTDGRLLRQLTRGPWTVTDLSLGHRAIKAVDEGRRLVYFAATEKSPTERHLYKVSLDSPAQAPQRVTREDGLHDITMSPDAKFYLDQFSSISQPPQTSLHRSDGSLLAYLLENKLDATHPYAPYLADHSSPEFGTLSAADGQTLHYRLYKPAHFDPTKRYPAIVDVYGGPGVQRVLNNWTGNSFTQILTRAGYLVFQLDNRGSAFRGDAFQAPIQRRMGDIEVTDQVLGAHWLAQQSFCDPTRIGVWGWSYGGYMSLMLMFKAPEVFRAGVAGAPVTDWRLYDTHYTERYLGRPQQNEAGYEASSVLPYAKNLKGHLLIVHGMADDNVLFLHSTKLFRRLQDLNLPFEIMVYPGGKHGLARQQDGRHAYKAILNFFDANLRGK